MNEYDDSSYFIPPSLPDEICVYRSPPSKTDAAGPDIIFRTNVHAFPEMDYYENLMSNLNSKFHKQSLAMESFAISRKSAMSQESAKYKQQLEAQEREHALLMQQMEEEENAKRKLLHEIIEEVERNEIDLPRLEKVVRTGEQKLSDHPHVLSPAQELVQQCHKLVSAVSSKLGQCRCGDDEAIAQLSHILHHSPVVHRLGQHASILDAKQLLRKHSEEVAARQTAVASTSTSSSSSSQQSPRRSSSTSHAVRHTTLPDEVKSSIACGVEQACTLQPSTSDFITSLHRLQITLLRTPYPASDVIQECFNAIDSSDCSTSQERMLRVSFVLYVIVVKVLNQDLSVLATAFASQSALCIPTFDNMTSSMYVSIWGATLCVAAYDYCTDAPGLCLKWITSFQQHVNSWTDAHVTVLLAFLNMTTCVLSLFYGKRFCDIIQSVNSLPKSLSERSKEKLDQYVTSLSDPKPLDSHLMELLQQWKSDFNNLIMSELRAECEAVEKNTTDEVKQLKEAMDMRRLNFAFNILGVEPETQVRALEILQEKFLKALQYGQPSLLSYVVYKIVPATLRQAQDEQFSVGTMGQAIATVVSATSDIQLLSLLPHIRCTGAVYHMQFNRICPFTIPRFHATGEGDEYYKSMGYNRYTSGKWEADEKWMNRMNKIVGTYAYVLVQPDCTYFTVSLAWQWIAGVVNHFMKHESPANVPSAKLVDTFLRVVSPKLMEVHGAVYVALMNTVKQHVLPKMSSDETFFPSVTHKKKLEDFLEAFINSNGRECPSAI